MYALLLSILIQSIEDLKLKPRKRMNYVKGCSKEAQKFILSIAFEEICNIADLDDKALRNRLQKQYSF